MLTSSSVSAMDGHMVVLSLQGLLVYDQERIEITPDESPESAR